jgi:hypothetical protein
LHCRPRLREADHEQASAPVKGVNAPMRVSKPPEDRRVVALRSEMNKSSRLDRRAQ